MKLEGENLGPNNNLKYCKIIDRKYTNLLLKEFLSWNNQQILNHETPLICELFQMLPSQIFEPFSFTFGCAVINVYEFTKNEQLLDELNFLSTNLQQQITYQYVSVLLNGNSQNQSMTTLVNRDFDECFSYSLNGNSREMNSTLQRLSKMVEINTQDVKKRASKLRYQFSTKDRMKQKKIEHQ